MHTAPGLFQVELTNHCNIDCAMCARSSGLTRPVGNMDLALFRAVVDQSRENNFPIHWLHHFGETLIYPELEAALEYFKNFGLGPGAVSTNAILLNKDKREILLRHAKRVLCCMDSMDSVAYRKIRNNNYFERVKENIASLIDEKQTSQSSTEIIVQFLRSECNRDENFTDIVDYFGSVEGVRFIEKRTDKHPSGGDIRINFAKSARTLKQDCPKMRGELCVLWTGECVPCCWDADGTQIIGDINLQPLDQIWMGEAHREMIDALSANKRGVLKLCDNCAGPIDDNTHGLAERIKAYARDWVLEKKRVAFAPASATMIELVDSGRIADVEIVAMLDRSPRHDERLASRGIPVLPHAEADMLDIDTLFIFSPQHSTDIYRSHQALKDKGVEIQVIGEFL